MNHNYLVTLSFWSPWQVQQVNFPMLEFLELWGWKCKGSYKCVNSTFRTLVVDPVFDWCVNDLYSSLKVVEPRRNMAEKGGLWLIRKSLFPTLSRNDRCADTRLSQREWTRIR
ncbi:hypothetical protein Tco_0807608 [Tanacetum coccineum]